MIRPWTLLNQSFHPRAAMELRAARTTRVRWAQRPEQTSAGTRALEAEQAVAVTLPLGLLDTEIRSELRGAEASTLLHLDHAELPIFGGFASAADGAEFEEEVRRWVIPGISRFSGTWCCTHAHYQAGTLLYKIPRKLPSGPQWAATPRAKRLQLLESNQPENQHRECYWDDCSHLRATIPVN